MTPSPTPPSELAALEPGKQYCDGNGLCLKRAALRPSAPVAEQIAESANCLGKEDAPTGETLDQYADRIVAKTRRNMLDRLPDDVIGRISKSHLVFGKACAMEAVWTAMREMGDGIAAKRSNPQPAASAGAVDAVAKAIYETSRFGRWFGGTKPDWVAGGNSIAQDEARDYARAALSAQGASAGARHD